jgi:hypothetical protein
MKKPQRMFLRWFGGPKLVQFLTVLGARYRSRTNAPVFINARVGLPVNSTRASLHDLRVAKADEWHWIPLTKIRSQRAQAFSAQQHPYVRFLRDGLGGFEEYLEGDKPSTSAEYLFLSDAGTLTFHPIPSDSARVWPWSPRLVSLTKPPGFPHLMPGPKSRIHLLSEAERLDRLRKSIEKNGFEVKQGEIPWYSLLIYDNGNDLDYRVFVQHGNHRVAVLAHLGWDLIPMVPLPNMLRNEIWLSEAESWPGVLDGSFSLAGARAAFMAFFREFDDPVLPNLD